METAKKPSVIREKILWFNEHVLNPETRTAAISINFLYCVFAMVMLLNHVYVTLYFPKYYNFSAITPVPWCIFGIVSIILGRMWKDWGFWLLFLLAVLQVVRMAVATDVILNGIVFSSLYAFGGCYGVARVQKKEHRKRFLYVFCILWTLAMVIYSCIAIYVAWTGETIKNLATGSFRIGYGGEQRLYPLYHPVQAGVMAGVSFAVALVGCIMTQNKIGKGLFILASMIMIVFGILTASRVNHILNAFVISALLCILIHKQMKTPVKIWKWIILSFVGAGLFILLIYIQGFGIETYNKIRNNQIGLIRSAVAAEGVGLTSREIVLDKGMDSFLNGRMKIWQYVFEAIQKNPNTWLWGCSADSPMSIVNKVAGWNLAAHAHNTWIQILLENGIPGVLLYLGFTILFIKHAVQLALNHDCDIWMRMLPVPALACLIGDLTDITSYANTGHPQVTILFLFAGMTIATNKLIRKQKKEGASLSS